MKLLIALPALLLASLIQARSGTSAGATYVGHETVTGCAKASTLFTESGYSAICYRRTMAGGAEIHAGLSHVWYIMDGEATLVTGGTVLESRIDSPGEIRGTGLQGGQTHHLTKGDVIAIPAGLPHWFKEVTTPIAYYSVNVDKK